MVQFSGSTIELGKGKTRKITRLVQRKLTRDHVFVSNENTPLTHRSGLYHAFMRCCARAGIQTKTLDHEGKVVEHVDVHSLRRTFASDLILNVADPKTVQELLGHRTLDMIMRIYTKVRSQNKRQTLGRLSYGQGALAPDGVLDYHGRSGQRPFPVQSGHKSVTSPKEASGQ